MSRVEETRGRRDLRLFGRKMKISLDNELLICY
jgi:hypothetical protein